MCVFVCLCVGACVRACVCLCVCDVCCVYDVCDMRACVRVRGIAQMIVCVHTCRWVVVCGWGA